ncbi:DsbA family protein [Rhizobium leguminosarum]|nr:DsbA family protein [Rhizobium leguminosarum]MBY2974424.1 DsbA family protein [Rhizobium leguminosarum]MBY2981906.1 DsbA family protein [Rhizobium leguminosarum]MBY3010373.1 DsbA family protein [Rhizobium leguminosarum]
MELVLAADPMCSWCYGFGKQMGLLLERRPVSLKIILGGLRAGATDVLDDAGKQFRLHHWGKVEEASGVPFNREGLLARKGFVYDTEPVCRAVVTARILKPEADLLSVFRAFQHAFYVDALDTTDGSVLAVIGSRALTELGHPVSSEEFLAEWNKRSTIEEAATDFATVRAMGVSSFPTLFLKNGETLRKVGAGYAHVDELEKHLAAMAA